MVDTTIYTTGDRVEYMCITCGEERGHLVAALSKKGRITRVTCPVCSSRVIYKSAEKATRSRAAAKPGLPYDQKRTYRKGQTLTHHMFGPGEVTGLVDPGKMDVLFADRLRRLIHGHE